MLVRYRARFFSMVFLMTSGVCAGAQSLIGTYDINYRYNAAGNPPNGSSNDGNPYFNIQPYGTGPYFIDVAPGDYRVVVAGYGTVGPSVADIWSGSANGGTHLHTPSPGGIGDSIDFTHASGQIALYYWDWFAGDNDPNISTTVKLFRLVPTVVPEPGTFALLMGTSVFGAGLLVRRQKRA